MGVWLYRIAVRTQVVIPTTVLLGFWLLATNKHYQLKHTQLSGARILNKHYVVSRYSNSPEPVNA
jgi:hypothetical protein